MTEQFVSDFTRPGAHWWKVDFHAHSPASFDFGGAGEGSRASTQTTYREWLLSYMASGIDALVIADHNTHEGIDKARAELALMRASTLPGFREIALLAGVELTVDGGYHLLAVFDVDTKSEDINGLLHVCGFSAERGTSDSTTKYSFSEVVDEIVKLNGLAIPAHADMEKGLFGHDGRNQAAIINTGSIIAAEIVTEEGKKKAAQAGWICVLGSDAHHLDGSNCPKGIEAKFPGSHFTWVKMETPNLFGIKLALSDGAQSVIPAKLGDDNQNDFSHSTIDKLIVRKSGHESEYSFGPWMNTVIGGRGVGKSTLIEAIRLAMGRFTDLPQELQKDNDWFSPQPSRIAADRFWDSATQIEVHLSRLDREYKVLWRGSSPSDPEIHVLTNDIWVPERGAPRDRFAMLINSQKQIYETSRDAQSLLKAIDDQPSIGYVDWKKKFDELCSQYRTQRAKLEELEVKIADEDRLRGEISDVEAELRMVTKLRDSDEARELDILLAEEHALTRFEESAQRFETAMSIIVGQYNDLAIVLEENSEGTQESQTPIWDSERLRRDTVEEAYATTAATLHVLEQSRELWQSMSHESPRLDRINELNSILKPTPEAESPADSISQPAEDPNEANTRLIGAKATLVTGLSEVDDAKIRHARLIQESASVLAQIVDHRAELTTKRIAQVQKLSGADLKLQVLSQADDSEVEAALRTLTGKSSSYDNVFAGLIETLDHPFKPGRAERASDLKTLLKELHDHGQDSPLFLAKPKLAIDQRFFSHLKTLDKNSFDTDVDLWFPEDRLRVQYRQDGSNGLQEIDQGSPGQKTAALLAVVLQLSNDPLILDQPEDDLDNKLIYDLVVSTLKRIKSDRQIIAVTHNANVVVNADAEHVTVLAHGPIPVVEASGAIQDDTIRKSICLIMEGGEPAFEARYRRLMN